MTVSSTYQGGPHDHPFHSTGNRLLPGLDFTSTVYTVYSFLFPPSLKVPGHHTTGRSTHPGDEKESRRVRRYQTTCNHGRWGLRLPLWIGGFTTLILQSRNPPLVQCSRLGSVYPKHGNMLSDLPRTNGGKREGSVLLCIVHGRYSLSGPVV